MTDAEQAARTDLIFKALASGVRREIMRVLATSSGAGANRCCGDEICACTFSELLGIGAPTVSHHMKTLLEAGLVVAEKRGLWVYYRLAPRAIDEITGAVNEVVLGKGPEARPTCDCD